MAMAKEIANSLVISFDQDPDAIANGRKAIEENGLTESVHLYKSNFSNFNAVIKENEPKIMEEGGFNGILMDLGVSSHHFDKGERGFSFNKDAPLDMRMDYENDEIATAADILNNSSEQEIEEIIRCYGEDRFSKQIARNVVEARSKAFITTTKQLEDIIFHSYPKKMRFGKTHPATRSFQALRIAVNRELSILREVLPYLIAALDTGGRLLVISFHSLEDRIVKHIFKDYVKANPQYKILTKKPITPSEEEILENSRSRSAKLRIIERVE